MPHGERTSFAYAVSTPHAMFLSMEPHPGGGRGRFGPRHAFGKIDTARETGFGHGVQQMKQNEAGEADVYGCHSWQIS